MLIDIQYRHGGIAIPGDDLQSLSDGLILIQKNRDYFRDHVLCDVHKRPSFVSTVYQTQYKDGKKNEEHCIKTMERKYI